MSFTRALKCDALRRFRRGSFLHFGLKAPILTPIHAKSGYRHLGESRTVLGEAALLDAGQRW